MGAHRTKIEWADRVVNFMTGCGHGCPWCYARRTAHRFAAVDRTVYNRLACAGLDPFRPAVHGDVYERAQRDLGRLRAPQRVFVSSMGDVGCAGGYCYTDVRGGRAEVRPHGSDSRRAQDLICALARGAAQHTYCVLTKRPAALLGRRWPRNVHVGTSVSSTREAAAHDRLRALSLMDAAVRWVSVEPLLDPAFDPDALGGVDWVVVGGLSRGSGRLPAGVPAAARRIVAWAWARGTPCFVKDNIAPAVGDGPRSFPPAARLTTGAGDLQSNYSSTL